MAGQPFVMFPRAAAPWVFDHIAGHFTAGGRPGPRISQTAVSGQTGMVDEAAATGAVAAVSRSLVTSLARPGVRFVPFEPPLTVPIHLAWHFGPTPATARTISAFQAEARVTAGPEQRAADDMVDT